MLAASNMLPEKKKARHVEDKLQVACVRWMEMQYPHYAAMLHHSPNGGARSKKEGAMFKAMGTRAGFPDLFLYLPSFCDVSQNRGEDGARDRTNVWYGLAVEMKTTEKGSRQSEAQKAWEARLKTAGYRYEVCRTLEEFMTVVNEYIKGVRI